MLLLCYSFITYLVYFALVLYFLSNLSHSLYNENVGLFVMLINNKKQKIAKKRRNKYRVMVSKCILPLSVQ